MASFIAHKAAEGGTVYENNLKIRMITLKEAVVATGMSESALRADVAARRIPAIRVGRSGRGKIMFELGELNKALIQLVRSNMRATEVTETQTESIPKAIEAVKDGNEEKVAPFTVFRKVN